MYILDANAYARNPAGAAESIQKMVDKIDGEMLASRLWNEQKLAYPIKGRYKGAYWLSYFRCDSTRLTEFNRSCQLADIVLRHLAVKVEPRLVDALVSVAKGEVPAAAPATDDAPTTTTKEPASTEA